MAIVTGSMVVQFNYEEEDIGLKSIERQMSTAIERQFRASPLDVIHLECSVGNLKTAFRVEGVDA